MDWRQVVDSDGRVWPSPCVCSDGFDATFEWAWNRVEGVGPYILGVCVPVVWRVVGGDDDHVPFCRDEVSGDLDLQGVVVEDAQQCTVGYGFGIEVFDQERALPVVPVEPDGSGVSRLDREWKRVAFVEVVSPVGFAGTGVPQATKTVTLRWTPSVRWRL